MKNIAFTIGGNEISPPKGVPQGGIGTGERAIQIGVTLMLVVGISITLYYLVTAGIQWTMSGGDKQRIEQARLRIVYSIIGLVVMLLSFFIMNIVFHFFGIGSDGQLNILPI